MIKITKEIAGKLEVDDLEPKVVEFRAQFDEQSLLDEIVQSGSDSDLGGIESEVFGRGVQQAAVSRRFSSARLVTPLAAASKNGWTLVDMKADWKNVFPETR